MKGLIRTLIVLVILGGLGAGGWVWYARQTTTPTPSFRAVPVKRGELVATISATGTVEPEEVVDVGAQVAGQVNTFGKDKNGKAIDYGSVVEEGTLLAQIDDSLYSADVASATAQLEQSKVSVLRAEADLVQMKAKLFQALRDWERAQKLGPSDALSETSYDAYKAAYETTKANVAVGEAVIAQAKAAVLQSEAALKRSQRNLSYTTIKSPVKGVIIDRRVNIGQTVVASLNAPSLFLIAKDLTRMQVWVSVNEADIGSIHAGQPVSFTVDAYPGLVFRGEVGKVRFNATMTQNVVTYTVEVITDNSSGKLLPYLTANVQFEVAKRQDVLLVPNIALRWKPVSQDQIAPDFRDSAGGGAGSGGGRGNGGQPGTAQASEARPPVATQPAEGRRNRPPGGSAGENAAGNERTRGMVWVQEGAFVKPIRVRKGMSDGTNTEVSSDQLQEGMAVVTGLARADQPGSDDARNPFMPQFPTRRGGGSGGQGGAAGGGGGPGGGAGGGGAGGGGGGGR